MHHTAAEASSVDAVHTAHIQRASYSSLAANCMQETSPVSEAFRILDPNGTGFVDLSRMRAMMERLWPQDQVGLACTGG